MLVSALHDGFVSDAQSVGVLGPYTVSVLFTAYFATDASVAFSEPFPNHTMSPPPRPFPLQPLKYAPVNAYGVSAATYTAPTAPSR